MSGISTNRTNVTLPTDLSREIMQKTQDSSAVMRLARRGWTRLMRRPARIRR